MQLIPSRAAQPHANPLAEYAQAIIMASFSLTCINMPLSQKLDYCVIFSFDTQSLTVM